jgi:hypothetical protein
MLNVRCLPDSQPLDKVAEMIEKLQQARILLTNELATCQKPVLQQFYRFKTRLLTTGFVDHAPLSKQRGIGNICAVSKLSNPV